MKSLLVSGATGTFGRAFLPQALEAGYDRVVVYSRDEAKQHAMRREFTDPRLRWFLGDVRDRDRLKRALQRVDHVIHAAALKHVPVGEYCPDEFVKTNVLGALNLVEAAIDAEVSKVIALSSDKAVNPINLYGATKFCAERIFLASNALSAGGTRFSVTRYGNVMGSRGSFLELLLKLRSEGAKTYPLRDPDSTRFWITPEDAARFVRERLEDMSGGEIFVPKMRASNVAQFAREVFPEGEPEIVGLPSGEKRHEILISEEEGQFLEERQGFYVVRPFGPRRVASNPWTYRSDCA